MHASHFLNTFQFNHNLIFDEQIQTESLVEDHIVVLYTHWNLALHSESTLLQLITKYGFIN